MKWAIGYACGALGSQSLGHNLESLAYKYYRKSWDWRSQGKLRDRAGPSGHVNLGRGGRKQKNVMHVSLSFLFPIFIL